MPVPMRAARALSRAMSAAMPLESASSICCGMLVPEAARERLRGLVVCRVPLAVRALGALRRVDACAGEPADRVDLAAVYERFVDVGRLVVDVLRAAACRVPAAARLRGVGRCIPDGEDPLPGMAASFPLIGALRVRYAPYYSNRGMVRMCLGGICRVRADGGGGNGA